MCYISNQNSIFNLITLIFGGHVFDVTVDTEEIVSRKNGQKIVSKPLVAKINKQENNVPSLLITTLCSFLGIFVFIKTLFWAVSIGLYGVFFNFRKQTRWNKLGYIKRFAKTFGMIWYSFPNPKDNEKMYPAPTFFYGKNLPKVEIVRRYSKSWKALDPIYNYKFGEDKTFCGYFTDWWYGHRACQSVRNRLLVTESILEEKLLEIYKRKGSVKLLSIACGAAQAVINTAYNLKQKGIIVDITLIDFDNDALEYAKEMADKKGISDLLNTKKVNMFRNFGLVKGEYDIVEMVGFLDYLDKNKAKELISHIKKELLLFDGYFITANIMFNWDWIFVRWNINWWMIYRTSSQFVKILKSGDFSEEDILLTKEVHKVHCVAVCKNSKTLET